MQCEVEQYAHLYISYSYRPIYTTQLMMCAAVLFEEHQYFFSPVFMSFIVSVAFISTRVLIILAFLTS